MQVFVAFLIRESSVSTYENVYSQDSWLSAYLAVLALPGVQESVPQALCLSALHCTCAEEKQWEQREAAWGQIKSQLESENINGGRLGESRLGESRERLENLAEYALVWGLKRWLDIKSAIQSHW